MKRAGLVVIYSVVILLLGLSFFVSSSSNVNARDSSIQSPAVIPHKLLGTYKCSSSSPCPMGVADYGVNGEQSYQYTAVAFVSWVNFTTLKIGLSNHIRSSHEMTIQQNLVDYNVFENGASGEYWTQDVPFIKQMSDGNFEILELDNVWNFSASNAEMSGSISGNGLGDCAVTGGQPSYYYCEGKLTVTTTLPFEIQMVQITRESSAGSSTVEFAINVYHAGTFLAGGPFDMVTFLGTANLSPAFQVGGKNPIGLYNDAETVLCGPGDGASVKISSVQATISEAYSESVTLTGPLSNVPHAWSAGSDTAETVSGVEMSASTPGVGVASSGSDNNVQIW